MKALAGFIIATIVAALLRANGVSGEWAVTAYIAIAGLGLLAESD